MEEPEWNCAFTLCLLIWNVTEVILADQKHSGRNSVPRAHHPGENPQARARMGQPHRYWQTRVWRSSAFVAWRLWLILTLTFQYRSTDFIAPGPGKLQLIFSPADGSEKTTMNVYDFKGKGVAMSMYNTDEACLFILNTSQANAKISQSPVSRTRPSRWRS